MKKLPFIAILALAISIGLKYLFGQELSFSWIHGYTGKDIIYLFPIAGLTLALLLFLDAEERIIKKFSYGTLFVAVAIHVWPLVVTPTPHSVMEATTKKAIQTSKSHDECISLGKNGYAENFETEAQKSVLIACSEKHPRISDLRKNFNAVCFLKSMEVPFAKLSRYAGKVFLSINPEAKILKSTLDPLNVEKEAEHELIASGALSIHLKGKIGTMKMTFPDKDGPMGPLYLLCRDGQTNVF